MSQFDSGFWDVYITIVTVVSIVACAVLLWQQTQPAPAQKTTGHVWDEDLAEYNNPLPGWWRWLFYLTIIFAVIYLVLYPGLGSWRGTLGWSQISQLDDELAKAELQYGPMYEKFSNTEVVLLARNPEAMAVAQRLFLNNCAQCHASDAGGSRGFPNLTDRDWLWGGTPEAIKTTITQGRTGVMPPWGPALGDEGVKDVTHYVLSLSQQTNDSLRRARGEALFKTNCVACHGADGKGNQALGAPNLTDRTWLHGSGEYAIIETVKNGRANQMPAHGGLLSAAKIHLLTAYVYGLSAK